MSTAPAEPIKPEDHLGLVWKFARRYAKPGTGIDVRDLVNEGVIGLMTACENFDPSLGYEFGSYAGHWIRREILPAARNYHRTVPLPANVYTLTDESRREAKTGEIRPKYAGVGMRKAIDRAVRAANRRVYNQGDDGLMIAWLDGSRDRAPDEEAATRIDAAEILREFSPRHRAVIVAHYGLDGNGDRSFREIGAELGVSRNRAGQIHQDAMGKIRASIRAKRAGRKATP